MKLFIAQSKALGLLLLIVFLGISTLWIWNIALGPAINTIVTVRRCEKQMEKRLSIKPTYLAISDYAVSLLQPGMTRAEVKETLETIAPVEVLRRTSDVADVDEILITPCGNRFKNVLLWVYYSPDERFESVENAFDD